MNPLSELFIHKHFICMYVDKHQAEHLWLLIALQAKFEELLKIYPPEAIERKRYQKIAKAMGTRTTQQVASHSQKYFIKLANAGLPVPGRMPNMARYTKNKKVVQCLS